MLKVQKGDLDKMSLLFEQYHRRLYHFFYRLNRRRDVSEDLVQSVFERLLKYRSSYSGEGSFSTWIFQIARNVHADHYRKHQHEAYVDDLIDFNQLADESTGPDDHQPDKNELKWLQLALDQLDPTKKQTLVLSRFQGFKYKEIAEIMDCSESAVKVRVFRAIRELKVLINELKGV